MRTNLENPRIYSPRVHGLRLDNVVIALTGTFIVPTDGPNVYMLDPGLADKTVRLPVASYGNQVLVANAGTTNSLNVTDSGGVAQVTVPPRSAALFFSGPLSWVWLISRFTVSSSSLEVITASGAIPVTATAVQTNQSGTIVVTVPDSTLWRALHGYEMLTIFDASGTAEVNTVTINPSGAETFSGQATLLIDSKFGGYKLQPKVTSGWVIL